MSRTGVPSIASKLWIVMPFSSTVSITTACNLGPGEVRDGEHDPLDAFSHDLLLKLVMLHRSGFVSHYYNDVTRRRKVTVDEHECLAERCEKDRTHMKAVAYRMLGSPSEAEDAVQEAWLHLSRSDTSSIENMGGWSTTVVARICPDMLDD